MEPEAGAGGGAAAGVPPTCFRHPGRETYLSCVRCGRSACPDCLRDAPVGRQCVECVKEGNRGVRMPAAAFGGRAVSTALVTYVLVGINVACYLAEWVYPRVVNYFDMIGGGIDHLHRVIYDPTIQQAVGVAQGQDYRLLTSAFLHEPGLSGFGPAHIIFNMWALLIVGPSLEQTLGRLRFIGLYLLSALGGSVLFYLVAPADAPAFGASGAIFGLFAAWFVVARKLRADPRPIMFLIVINLVITFSLPGIAWQAHIGGLLTGGLLAAAFAYAPRSRRTLVQAAATLAVIAVLVIAVIARTHALMG